MSELSLAEAAARLGVRPATVLYWLRAYPDVLAVPVHPQTGPRFFEHHLAALRIIREAALEAGHSEHHVRELLAAHRTLAEADTSLSLQGLAEEVKALRAEVIFLAEESKELQRMVGILIQHVLGEGKTNGSAPAGQPVNAWSPPRLK